MAIMHLLLQRMKYRKLAEMQWQIIPIIRIGQSILHHKRKHFHYLNITLNVFLNILENSIGNEDSICLRIFIVLLAIIYL